MNTETCKICSCIQKTSFSSNPITGDNGELGTLGDCSNEFYVSLLKALSSREQSDNIPKERSDQEPEPSVGLLFVVERDDKAKGESRYRKIWGRSQRDGEHEGFKRSHYKSKQSSGKSWRRERYISKDSEFCLIHIKEDHRRLTNYDCKCQELFKTTKRKHPEQLDCGIKKQRTSDATSEASSGFPSNAFAVPTADSLDRGTLSNMVVTTSQTSSITDNVPFSYCNANNATSGGAIGSTELLDTDTSYVPEDRPVNYPVHVVNDDDIEIWIMSLSPSRCEALQN